jgi:hypothetical protein
MKSDEERPTPLRDGTVYLCRASGEGSHNFRVCTDEAGVMAFYKAMWGEDHGGGIQSAIDHFRDPDNWSNDRSAYSCELYCSTFEVWIADPKELFLIAPSEMATMSEKGAALQTGREPDAWLELHEGTDEVLDATLVKPDGGEPGVRYLPLYCEAPVVPSAAVAVTHVRQPMSDGDGELVEVFNAERVSVIVRHDRTHIMAGMPEKMVDENVAHSATERREAEVLLHVKTYLTGAHNVDRKTTPNERIGLALQRIEARLDHLARQSGPDTTVPHVCGLQGYNPMIDPECPGCAARRPVGPTGVKAMSDHYILEGKTPVKTDLMTWARWFETRKGRHVAQTKQGDVRVSTVFLGLNHQWGDGPPLVFETMIFGGEHDQYQERYSTWDEAEAGHRKACELAGVPYTAKRATTIYYQKRRNDRSSSKATSIRSLRWRWRRR